MLDLQPYWQNYIVGDWIDGGAGRINFDNPGTGSMLAEQALANHADVDLAVRAARRVHENWALSDPRPVERG